VCVRSIGTLGANSDLSSCIRARVQSLPPLSSHCLNVVRTEHEGCHAEAYGGLDVASWPVGQPLLDSLRRQLAGASANMHTTRTPFNVHFAARMNFAAGVARLQTSCEMLTAWPTLWLTGGLSLVWQKGPRRSSPCKRPGDQPARRLRARDNHEKIWQTISKQNVVNSWHSERGGDCSPE
jgi:hypothetical protein